MKKFIAGILLLCCQGCTYNQRMAMSRACFAFSDGMKEWGAQSNANYQRQADRNAYNHRTLMWRTFR